MPQRLEQLLSWQALYSERINRMVFFILVVTTIYSYYGLVYPILVSEKTIRFQQARADLRILRTQFNELQKRYRQLARTLDNQEGVCNPLEILRDQIGWSLQHTSLSGPASNTLSLAEIDALNRLEESVDTLNQLYNEWRNTSEPTLSLDRFTSTDVTDTTDPADGRLANLLELERAISSLRLISASPFDSILAEQARKSSIPKGSCDVNVQDRLTLNVPIFRELSEYISPKTGLLKFEPSSGLRSYELISRFAGAPITIDTTGDLLQLEKYVAGMSEKAASEIQNPYQLPIVNIGVERRAILIAGPFALMVLFYLLAVYARKSHAIVVELTSVAPTIFTLDEFIHYGPSIIYSCGGAATSPVQSLDLTLVHSSFARAAQVSLLLYPLIMAAEVLWAFNFGPVPPYSVLSTIILTSLGLVCCLVSLFEAVLVLRSAGAIVRSTFAGQLTPKP